MEDFNSNKWRSPIKEHYQNNSQVYILDNYTIATL